MGEVFSISVFGLDPWQNPNSSPDYCIQRLNVNKGLPLPSPLIFSVSGHTSQCVSFTPQVMPCCANFTSRSPLHSTQGWYPVLPPSCRSLANMQNSKIHCGLLTSSPKIQLVVSFLIYIQQSTKVS